LNGIDTPEMRSKNRREKDLAEQAKAKLEELVLNKNVNVLGAKRFDKYGRLLIDLRFDGCESVCEEMLKHEFCHPYDGRQRASWKVEEEEEAVVV
jgi:endonuclease YncB( thermonuclease family)